MAGPLQKHQTLMIAFAQPFSIAGAGGGSRILRSLLEDAPVPYLSVYASPFPTASSPSQEINVPRRPYFGYFLELASRKLGNALEYATLWSQRRFEREMTHVFQSRDIRAIHCIPQGIEYWYTYRVARALDLPYALTVHDELSYNVRTFPYSQRAIQHLGEVWREADARFVISDDMGQEYNQRYGKRPYTMVTDGVRTVPEDPKDRPENSFHVYFMGAIHTAYEANFHTLILGLERVQACNPNLDVHLTIRGGVPFSLPDASIPITQKDWGTQDEVEQDMNDVDYLYFPLPFEPEFDSFVRYSLSTKMVTYLGSGLPIVFHGPEYSAAGRLLARNNAAISLHTTDPDALAQSLTSTGKQRRSIVRNALSLANSQFRIESQRERFWGQMLELMNRSTPVLD